MLEKEQLANLLNEMSPLIDSPHVISAVSLDGDRYHYGAKVAGVTPIQMVIFALNLLYMATDEHMTDDEIVKSIALLRKLIAEHSIRVGPGTDDETH